LANAEMLGEVGVQSLARAFEVLRVVAESQKGASQGAIIQSTGLNRTTVWRIVTNLCALGALRPDSNGSYTLGPRLIALGEIARNQMISSQELIDILRRLRDETGETCHFAGPERDGLVYLEKMESTRPVRAASRVGGHLDLHCTALGKAYLAFVADATRIDLLGSMEFARRTSHTIGSRAQYESELATVRNRGWALDNEENELEIRCVAAPVLDSGGHAVAAVSVSVPTSRLPLSQVPAIARIVTRSGVELSHILGGVS